MNKVRTIARVRWFSRISGEGMVRVTIGDREHCLPIYACNIKGKKTWYPETACVYYEKDQTIEVEVKWDDHACFVIGLTPGTLDVEAWDRIKEKDLAFRCDDDGNATTGLFKGGAQ